MFNETFSFNDECVQRSSSDAIHYVLMNICKRNKNWTYIGEDNEWDFKVKTRYKEVDFMHVKWIIDRANFISNKWFGLNVIPSVYIHMYVDSHFVPEAFRLSCNHEETYYLSCSDLQCLNKAIKKWKMYGKVAVNLDNMKWKVINWFKKDEK